MFWVDSATRAENIESLSEMRNLGEVLPVNVSRSCCTTQGEFNKRLLIPASEEGRNTAKEDRPEPEEVTHSDEHSARDHRAIRD